MIFEYAAIKFIWWVLVTILVIAFIVAGGIDLGVAMLLPIVGKTDNERALMLTAIGPTWEGNQVWLVTLVGAIFAAWPLFFAATSLSLYFALLLMVVSLVLRPPGLDYRDKLPFPVWRNFWDCCLFANGAIAALFFGVVAGNLFLGMPFYYDEQLNPHFSGNLFSLLSPFALLLGIVSLCTFLIQGGVFLQYKLPSPQSNVASSIVKKAIILFIITFTISILWLWFGVGGWKITEIPNLDTSFAPTMKRITADGRAWIHNYQKYRGNYLLPMLAILNAVLTYFCVAKNRPVWGILSSSMGILATVLTLAVSLFPFILPSSVVPDHSLTIWDATSSYQTLHHLFWVVVIFLPIVLSYTSWVYYIMRGKVDQC